MAALIALIVMVFLVYIVVVAGAAAYELTGMERLEARFQALSAFTGTGFTTAEAQKAVSTPLRRQITSTLIVVGWLSAVSLVAALIEVIDVDTVMHNVRNLAVVLGVLGLGWYTFRWRGVDALLLDVLRERVMPRFTHVDVPLESLFRYQRGIGIARVLVPPESSCVGRTLRELHLPEHQLQVLLVEHEDHTVAVPGAGEVVEAGSHLVLFGRLSNIETIFRV